MGGKVFNLPRMPRAEYLILESEVRYYLDQEKTLEYHIPRSYADKPDFGDMDILFKSRPDWEQLRQKIIEDLGITEYKATGRVFSTVYKGLQTDFFSVPGRYLNSTYTFMSFNDLGNFIGRMCRRFNLKYGEEGLSYVYRRPGNENYKIDLEITQDFKKICAFLDLDYASWLVGFDSLESLYKWIIQSKCFSVAPYLDEIRGKMKGREKERQTVTKFVAWLKHNNIDQHPEFADRHSYVGMITEVFPEADLPKQLQHEAELERRELEISQKFNGKKVMRLFPHLQGKDLGVFIVGFKNSFEDFEQFVLDSTEEVVDQKLIGFAKQKGFE